MLKMYYVKLLFLIIYSSHGARSVTLSKLVPLICKLLDDQTAQVNTGRGVCSHTCGWVWVCCYALFINIETLDEQNYF